MSAPLSRSDRRRMRRLAEESEAIVEADRRFFRRRNDRTHRIRIAARAEVETLKLLHGAREAEPGECWYVVIRKISASIRVRFFSRGVASGDTDLPERACAAIFRHLQTRGDAKVSRLVDEMVRVQEGPV